MKKYKSKNCRLYIVTAIIFTLLSGCVFSYSENQTNVQPSENITFVDDGGNSESSITETSTFLYSNLIDYREWGLISHPIKTEIQSARSISVINLSTLESHQIVSSDPYIRNPVWLPDHKEFAYYSEGWIFIAPVICFDVEESCISHSTSIAQIDLSFGTNLAFSPDGKFLAIEKEGTIKLLILETGEIIDFVEDATNPAWDRNIPTKLFYVNSFGVVMHDIYSGITSVVAENDEDLGIKYTDIALSPFDSKVAFGLEIGDVHEGPFQFVINIIDLDSSEFLFEFENAISPHWMTAENKLLFFTDSINILNLVSGDIEVIENAPSILDIDFGY